MSSFLVLYLKACEESNINPWKTILYKIEEGRSSSSLNLSPIELHDDTCKAIGHALKKDVSLKELNLSNCVISDKGLSRILLGLERNGCLQTLNLTGNKISGTRTTCVAEFLRRNCHLQNLDLQLNHMGLCIDSFSDFCESLCVNTSLKSLDLKNNELNFPSAVPIAKFLERNYTLQKLDFRWNSIGEGGGKIIFKSLLKRTINNSSREDSDGSQSEGSWDRGSWDRGFFAGASTRFSVKEYSPTEIELQSTIANLKNEIEKEKDQRKKLEREKTMLNKLKHELRDTFLEAQKERDQLLAEKKILEERKCELMSNSM